MSIKNTRSGENGQAMVELALVLPLLVLVLMGVLDLGRGIYVYNVVSSAAREGARYGIIHPTNSDGIKNAAINTAVGVNLDPNQIQITLNCSPCKKGDLITVSVSNTFNPITLLFSPITMMGKSTMMIEYQP